MRRPYKSIRFAQLWRKIISLTLLSVLLLSALPSACAEAEKTEDTNIEAIVLFLTVNETDAGWMQEGLDWYGQIYARADYRTNGYSDWLARAREKYPEATVYIIAYSGQSPYGFELFLNLCDPERDYFIDCDGIAYTEREDFWEAKAAHIIRFKSSELKRFRNSLFEVIRENNPRAFEIYCDETGHGSVKLACLAFLFGNGQVHNKDTTYVYELVQDPYHGLDPEDIAAMTMLGPTTPLFNPDIAVVPEQAPPAATATPDEENETVEDGMQDGVNDGLADEPGTESEPDGEEALPEDSDSAAEAGDNDATDQGADTGVGEAADGELTEVPEE